MGAHSLGQFHHFNIATRTRLRMQAEALERRRKWIRDHRPPESVEVVTEKPRRWWSAIFQWIRGIFRPKITEQESE